MFVGLHLQLQEIMGGDVMQGRSGMKLMLLDRTAGGAVLGGPNNDSTIRRGNVAPGILSSAAELLPHS